MWFDLIVLAILLFAAYRGWQRGVIFQIAAIASVVLCFVFAEALSAAFAPALEGTLKPPLNHWVVMVGSYVVFSFVAFGFARVLDGWVEKARMKEFNRHLGAGFGLLKGLVFCLVLTFFAVTMSTKTREALRASKSAPYAAVVMDRLHPVMPERLQGALNEYLAYFDKSKLRQQQDSQGGLLDRLPFEITNDQTNSSGTDSFGNDGLGDLGLPEMTPPSGQRPGGSDSWNPFGGTSTNTSPRPSNDPWTLGQNQPSTNTNQPTDLRGQITNVAVDAVMQRLPWSLSAENERLVRQALENATPTQRQQMESQLQNADGWAVGDLARSWLNQQFSGQQPAQPQQPTNTNAWGNLAGDLIDRATGQPQPPNQPRPSTQDQVRDVIGNVGQQWLNNQLGSQQPSGNAGANDTNTMIRDIANRLARGDQNAAANMETQIRRGLQTLPQQGMQSLLSDWQADLNGQGQDPDPNTNRSTPFTTRVQRTLQRLGANDTPFFE